MLIPDRPASGQPCLKGRRIGLITGDVKMGGW